MGISDVDVLFNVASKKHVVKTDKKGYESIALALTPNKYKITVSCEGKTVKNKITVKNVIKAKNLSKKKSKKIKYSASLKTSKGKAIVGKKIIFKIKGKTYKAKTNKKGIASVKLKNLKVGKYKITIQYLKFKLNRTLKVKK